MHEQTQVIDSRIKRARVERTESGLILQIYCFGCGAETDPFIFKGFLTTAFMCEECGMWQAVEYK